MLKRLTLALAMLLVVAVCSAVFVTVWSRHKMGEPVEMPTSVEIQNSAELSSRLEPLSDNENTTVGDENLTDEFSSKTFASVETIKVKLKTRSFKKQNDRIKLYKQYFETVYKEKSCDVFLYDLTHDGLADMIVASPIYDDAGKKVIGSVVQLFTIIDEKVVTEIFRDYGGFGATGGSFCCYVTENETGDCLLISKDDMKEGVGKLSYSVFYVLEDGMVVNCASSQYISKEAEAYENEQALNKYSSGLETELKRAHTTIVDYRIPFAVTSTSNDAFGKYFS